MRQIDYVLPSSSFVQNCSGVRPAEAPVDLADPFIFLSPRLAVGKPSATATSGRFETEASSAATCRFRTAVLDCVATDLNWMEAGVDSRGAGDRCPLASCWIPNVLDKENRLRSGTQPVPSRIRDYERTRDSDNSASSVKRFTLFNLLIRGQFDCTNSLICAFDDEIVIASTVAEIAQPSSYQRSKISIGTERSTVRGGRHVLSLHA
jgi:hypothetical protein